ncbi:glycosyltransferase [Thiohalocapsa marina]|uniref:Glycosyltransferase n=2 Tax=Thiohalocapsa marina TaxID=424902 RepID=A0A5M8FFC1_9GAMM|nr:glycosyltransferase [Thiohalocapsa marina]
MSNVHPRAQTDLIRIAVLIPCFNEAAAIEKVIFEFRDVLPDAQIYVYDNNSTDGTATIARNAGALTRYESTQGKGHVVCRMFSEIDADVYLLTDGDGTYDAASAPGLILRLISDQLDMVCGARIATGSAAYRPGHRFGNRLLTALVAAIFGSRFRDMLTGYRVFSRRYVKSFPALSEGFEIETQLTVHALEMRMRVAEIPTPYFERPVGSISKLHTVRDGWRILRTIVYLLKEERPLTFFSAICGVLAAGSVLLAVPVVAEYIQTGLVPRFPTAILATGMMLLAFLSLASGLIVDTVSHGRREMKRLYYLALPPLPADETPGERRG